MVDMVVILPPYNAPCGSLAKDSDSSGGEVPRLGGRLPSELVAGLLRNQVARFPSDYTVKRKIL